MRPLLLILICFSIFDSFAQESVPWINIGKTNLIFGINQGSHPNLINGKVSGYTSIESALTIKNIPLNLSMRYSTERFISGKSTFFRLSYDGSRRKGINKSMYLGELNKTNGFIVKCLETIYMLEAKIAYWQLKKEQLEQTNQSSEYSIPEYNLLGVNTNIPVVDSLNLDSKLNIPAVSAKPEVPEINKGTVPNMQLDSINSLIDGYNLNLMDVNKQRDSLLDVKDKYLAKINSIDLKMPLTFLGGIDKLDLGLTSMSHGSMSNNTIPIQGIRVKGKYRKSFYDAAAGSTLPNRLFSSSVFDQVTNNTQNVFNMNQFYTVNTSRFISSLIVGYGNTEKNSISVENFYNGRELKNIFSNIPGKTNLTSNISGTWIFARNWSWNVSIGKTFKINDSIKRSFQEDLAFRIGTKYRWVKVRTEIIFKVKQIGNGYDGYSQGLYNSGYSKMELGVNSKITEKLNLQVIGIYQKFNRSNTDFNGMETKSGTVDLQWHVTNRLVLFGGYTLLEASGMDTLAKGLNHLGKGGFTWVKKEKNLRTELSGLGAYSQVNRIDSNIRLVNTSLHGVLDWRIIGAGIRVSLQDYSGLTVIYGVNWIIKPELKIHYKGIIAQGSYNMLISEQFGNQSGFSCRISASPSENITWEFNAAKWLPTEALYIPLFNTERYTPYYFDFKLRVFLNTNKK